jgi:HEAT repeat protein
MRHAIRTALAAGILVCAGCSSGSTAHWLEQLKAPDAKTRLQAVRTLQQRPAEAAQIVPVLTDVLKDEDTVVRRDAAWTLGSFGEESRSAVPALQAALRDREASVRKAAGQALKKIDPATPRNAATQ